LPETDQPLFCVALAEDFEEDDASGDGDVERFYRTGSGQRNDKVAAFARQVVEALAFAAEDYTHWGCIVGLGVAFVGAFTVACFEFSTKMKNRPRRFPDASGFVYGNRLGKVGAQVNHDLLVGAIFGKRRMSW
jgi:hypothetical protein